MVILRQAWIKGCVPSLVLKKDLRALKVLREDATSHVLWGLCFFFFGGGTLFYGSSWRQMTDTLVKARHPWIPADCELSPSHQASGSGAGSGLRSPLEKE